MNASLKVPVWFVLLAVLACGGWAVSGGRALASRWTTSHAVLGSDELAWIEHSFPSAVRQAEALRGVHSRHAAERAAAAHNLDHRSRRFVERVREADGWSEDLEREIAAWDSAAARSHLLTWRYIYEMSASLDPKEGRAYRVEMARRILGSVPLDSVMQESALAHSHEPF